MGVLVLTVLLSLVLVSVFVFLFLGTRKEDGFGGAERHSLLPFDDDEDAPPDREQPR